MITPERSDDTAGIIVIGDEILKGQTADTNSHFLCKHLFTLGVKVKKITTVGDNLDEIAKEVAEFSKKFTHVITSGGVGPTHDDITFEAVAKAFEESTVLNPVIVDICKKFFKTEDLSSPVFKMALIPASARLEFGVSPVSRQKNFYPLVCIKNVYMFPGIPFLLEKAFLCHQKLFLNPHAQMHTSELYVNSDEVSITNILNKVDAKFTKVQLGSYPIFYNSPQSVVIDGIPRHVGDVRPRLTSLLPTDDGGGTTSGSNEWQEPSSSASSSDTSSESEKEEQSEFVASWSNHSLRVGRAAPTAIFMQQTYLHKRTTLPIKNRRVDVEATAFLGFGETRRIADRKRLLDIRHS
ncbi:FLAD1 [Acanthosepion pharaonis]|uniref:FLAD1 n=1 Tax=Acanthosepion pharaonis TaxID=158019 RepID=A0A812EH71_ACAPH|nr:FLAD1 [Sepia pharaonis]